MKKRIIALLLCVTSLVCCLTSCHDRKIDGDVISGAEIKMYLADMVYDFDPAKCFNNDSAMQICSLLYDTLFVLDENGKVKKNLVDRYEIIEDEQRHEYSMDLILRPDAGWSDGTYMSGDDVVYAWKRILSSDANNEAAALLYDIQNAREAKQGDCSIDDVGVYADKLRVHVTFVGKIDYDRFILNLTSLALAPLREDICEKQDVIDDWSKKSATTVASGAFMLRRANYGLTSEGSADMDLAELVLERNPYYFRLSDAKYLDTSVAPYKIKVNFAKSKEEQLTMYANNEIFYVGDIALAQRANYKDVATVTDLLSTHTYYFNENAEIAKADGTTEKLFANANVRLALSAAIDRQAIADAVVFAKPATALVPGKVFETNSAKTTFRSVGGDLIKTTADTSAAQSFISAAGITPADYTFAISVRGEDEVHMAIAETICQAWAALGFNVTVNAVAPQVNLDKYLGEASKDIYDDKFNEMFYDATFEVIAVDMQTVLPDAYAALAPFATLFSGTGITMEKDPETLEISYLTGCHKTGYQSEAYDALMENVLKAETAEDRAKLLHDAEKALLADMPVMPVLFNQNAVLVHADLSKVTTNYFGQHFFTKTKQKDYLNYIETVAQTDPEDIQ